MGDADALNLPLQKTVFIIQREALAQDEAIRLRVTQAGFRIVDQTLVHLTPDRATTYYLDKLLKPEDGAKKTGGRTARGTGTGRAVASTTARKEAAPPSTPTSPRDKTPRSVSSDDPSPRVGTASTSPGKTPRDNVAETADDAIAALSGGPIVVLLVEKQNAVKAMLDLVGPQNPTQWPSTPTCLRASFAQDGKHVGVRCSRFAYNVADETAFLFAHSGNNGGKLATDGDHAADDAGKAMVHLDALMDFLFPPNVQHPNSTGRLFVFSLYGPLDAKSRLRSGEKGMHVVTDIELNTMCVSIEREDILSVYGMIGLSRDEEEEVLRQADKHMKHLPRYTRADIQEMFRHVPHTKNDGFMSFHAMQRGHARNG
ncbi:hypothetical protein, variant 2 [Aphanomyces astaci]|uniref:Nucleoside diphosphate kinase-like domain-containing protein n=1 Tax=Aphanomyces astaci TaxID=112090 RepID=W4FP86_APHAT|nr:hypothetical protein, variant 2 [Aphanomyces astaci]ETV69307.1 hypothetical protein, variant 2 [Aphanomyces astaci]|eukprot:XP_009841164.1 hypothetical protein, variant 2 [Aphanomyces astaci]